MWSIPEARLRAMTGQGREIGYARVSKEVSHEALTREWPRLASWLREARQGILQRAISEDAAEWERHGKPADRLYRGSQLKEAQAWARRNTPSGNEVAFLRARAVSKVRSLVSVIAVVLLIVSSMGVAGCALTHPQPKPPDPTRVSNLQDNDRPGSLRYAVAKAPAGRTIRFDANLRGTILLTSGDLNIAKDLTLRGPGAGMLSISSGKSGYVVRVAQGVTVTISGLAFKNSKTSTGFIDNEGTLRLTNSIVSGNTTTGQNSAGGITNNGSLTVTNSTVSVNMAGPNSFGAGGIYNSGTLTLSNSTVSGNTAQDGGGIYNDTSGTLMLTSSTISGNSDGGIYTSGTLTLTSSTISGNSDGGITNSGTLTLSNSTISGNRTVCGGGGGITNDGTLTLSNSTISGNTAASRGTSGGINGCGATDGSGGGITNNGTLTLSNSTISGNTALYGGGGIVNENSSTLMLSNSTISDNTAGVGGGIVNSGTLSLTNTTVSGNMAIGPNNAGGGILIQSAPCSDCPPIAQSGLTFSTIYGNRASVGSDIAIQDFTLSSNGQVEPIKQVSQVKIGNSIVAGDPAHPGPDIVGMLTSSGYNLFQDNAGATFDPATNKQHSTDRTLSVNDLSNVFAAPVGLRNNGGLTKTYALATGSPALDAIPLQDCQVKGILNSRSGMYTDQRGVKRPDGNEQFCDIGAYESVNSG